MKRGDRTGDTDEPSANLTSQIIRFFLGGGFSPLLHIYLKTLIPLFPVNYHSSLHV